MNAIRSLSAKAAKVGAGLVVVVLAGAVLAGCDHDRKVRYHSDRTYVTPYRSAPPVVIVEQPRSSRRVVVVQPPRRRPPPVVVQRSGPSRRVVAAPPRRDSGSRGRRAPQQGRRPRYRD